MNLFSTLFNRKHLLPAILLFAIVYSYGLWDRSPDIDDAWLGEYAYWLAEDGYGHSELMRGVNKQEERFLVHHKLFNLHGALFIKIFGFSLYTLKAVSLLYFLFFILLFYLYGVRWKKIFNSNDFLFALLILLVFPWTFKYSFLYRPEVMMMFFGFAGFILLERYLNPDKGKPLHLFLSGLFFGLTMATHLNGLILASSAFFLLIWNKKYVQVFPYGLAVLFAFSIYFFDFRSFDDFELWRHQFFDSPSLDSLSDSPFWLKPFYNLAMEHMRFFHNLEIIVFSVFLFVSLIIGFKYVYKQENNLVRFAVLVFLITGLIAMHKSRQYILLNFPYLLLMLVLTIKGLKEGKIEQFRFGKSKAIHSIVYALFMVFMVTSTYFNIKLGMDKFSKETNRQLAIKYAGTQSEAINIVAPMTFIFNEIEHFNRVQGDLCYTELQKLDPEIYQEGFLKKAHGFDVDIMMISSQFWEKLGITAYSKGDIFQYYTVVDKTDNLIVFRRNE